MFLGENVDMELTVHAQVVAADIMGNGVLITFEDGKCALYSADLLFASVERA